MKYLYRAAIAAFVVAASAAPLVAGQVRLELKGGLVSLDAKDASVREILAEWARVGRTRIVNGERAPGGLLTLQLTDVPEKKALDIVLRASAGYIAAERTALAGSESQYDRIVVMAIPRPAAGGSPGIAAPPPPQDRGGGMGDRGNFYPPQPGVMVDDQDQPVVQPQPMPMPGAATQPGMPTTPAQPGQSPYNPGGQPTQPGTVTTPPAPRPGTPVKPPGSPDGGPGGQ